MATNGKTTSDKDLAIRLANAEAGSGGGKSVSDADLQRALQRVTGSPTDTAQQKKVRRNMVLRMISELESAGAAGKTGQFTGRRMQYGGMADMSAAPMIKQPQQRKRKASGFRTKYSKGGGVRSSKYKL